MPPKKTTKTNSDKKIKTGYAKDVAPNRVEAEEADGAAVPVATKKGAQEGRTSPAERTYPPGRYEAVSASEAMERRMARERGELEPIPGSVDEDALPEEVASDLRIPNGSFDPLGGPEETEPALAPAAVPIGYEPIGAANAAPPPEQKYLKQRCRVSLELTDGTMGLAAIAVTQTRYSVTVLLPLSDEGMTFIPQPGIEVGINAPQGKRWECYFPGTYFEIPELKLIGLVFVKKAEGNG